jgi:hypothetical protein
MPIYLLPYILIRYYLLNPCDIYVLAFLLTLNLLFEASSFPSLFGDNASSISSSTTPSSLKPCKFCLEYILCRMFDHYHPHPWRPSIFTLMLIPSLHFNAPSLVPVQECCLTYTLLVTLAFTKHQVAFGAIYAQVKKKVSRRISKSSRTLTSSRIRLATSPNQLHVVGCLRWLRFYYVYFDLYHVNGSGL